MLAVTEDCGTDAEINNKLMSLIKDVNDLIVYLVITNVTTQLNFCNSEVKLQRKLYSCRFVNMQLSHDILFGFGTLVKFQNNQNF